MGKDHGDMTGFSFNSKANASSSTQRSKNAFAKATRNTQPPSQPSKKEKEKVELQRPCQRSKKVEKRQNISFKGKSPISQCRTWENPMQS